VLMQQLARGLLTPWAMPAEVTARRVAIPHCVPIEGLQVAIGIGRA